MSITYRRNGEIYTDSGAIGPTERLASAPITMRVAGVLATVERSPVTTVLAGVLIAFGCFLLGWYFRGLFGAVYDNRGWAALVVFSIAGTSYMIHRCNQQQECD